MNWYEVKYKPSHVSTYYYQVDKNSDEPNLRSTLIWQWQKNFKFNPLLVFGLKMIMGYGYGSYGRVTGFCANFPAKEHGGPKKSRYGLWGFIRTASMGYEIYIYESLDCISYDQVVILQAPSEASVASCQREVLSRLRVGFG